LTTTVAIADDHALFAEGIGLALQAVPDISVVFTAPNGRALVDSLETVTPDVLLLDLEMPELNGLETLRALGTSHPPAIVVTMHASDEQRRLAAAAGACGFLSKSTPLPDLAAAVRAAAAGKSLLDATTEREILDEFSEPQLEPGPASLTAREKEVLAELAAGISGTEELAERLFISQKTVKNHLANIYEKLDVNDRTQAAVEAIRLGLRRPNGSADL